VDGRHVGVALQQLLALLFQEGFVALSTEPHAGGSTSSSC
jgi:hypothetical protein